MTMRKHEKTQVLLLYPKTGIDLGSTVAPPHALLTIAAPLLKAGYQVKILDQRVDKIDEYILRNELSGEPICVGITTMVGSQLSFALGLAEMARAVTKGKVPIVWGGCLPSVIPAQTIENEYVDCVVVGEGDLTLLDLVRAWEKKKSPEDISGIVYKEEGRIVKTNPRPLVDVETLLPVPWELVNVESYMHRDMYISVRRRVLDIGQTSRGCPFNCTFCSSASIRQRKWRPMSVKKSLNIIVETVKRFNLDGFWLRDDEFYIDRKRANEIFLGIIKANIDVRFYTSGTRCDVFMGAPEEEIRIMKEAGAHTLKFGAESGSQRILDLMHKGIKVEHIIQSNLRAKKHGIFPVFSLMIGYPTETFEEINQTIDLLYRLKKDNPKAQLETFAPYTAVPGTQGARLAQEHGLKFPKKLEEWTKWNYDEYDLENIKRPWLSKNNAYIWLLNINYMSILANSLPNVVGSIRNYMLKYLFMAIAIPVRRFYTILLRNKKYKFRPELLVLAHIRRIVFYRNTYTIK